MLSALTVGVATVMLGGGSGLVGFHQDSNLDPVEGFGGWYGWSTDLHESVGIIGSPKNEAGQAEVIYISDFNGSVVGSDTLTASDGETDDQFGYAVTIGEVTGATDGGVAFVSAPAWADSEGPDYEGAVYVFTDDGSGSVTESHQITLDNPGTFGARFGTGIDFDGVRLVVGAGWESLEDDGEGGEILKHGAAYVYTIAANGTPTLEQRLISDAPQFEAYFGTTVAIDGDQLVVSALGETGDVAYGGAVYVFERNESGVWVQTDHVRPDEAEYGASFSYSLDLAGDTLVVGSPYRSGGDNGEGIPYNAHGMVHIFERVGGVFTEVQQVVPQQHAMGFVWGWSLEYDGASLAIGAINWATAELGEGAVALWEQGPDGLFTQVRLIQSSDVAYGDQFGTSVALSGDRVLVGLWGQLDEVSGGGAYLFSRGCGGDFDDGGVIDTDDVMEVILDWGSTGISPTDIEQDLEVGIYDLLVLLEHYGVCG
ncbi:MAG: FG-GAP repeat protein [Phycisphaerales bacterium]|nr:FG-GAP repeat protein [Phycisphaerales bacterium]